MARMPTYDDALDAQELDALRRIEDSLRRYGFDPARALAQADDVQSREERIRPLLDRAAELLPPDELERLRREIDRAGDG